jgi:hypothetical protein
VSPTRTRRTFGNLAASATGEAGLVGALPRPYRVHAVGQGRRRAMIANVERRDF